MPKIINGSVKNAQLILKSYDLKLGEITYVPDMARNAVLKIYFEGDSISENDLIDKGSVIDLEVGNGLGNQIFDAPDLVNLDLEEARFTIIGSGLRLGNIIYEDSDLIIINKQSGIVTHPAPGNETGTLVQALLNHSTNKLSTINGNNRPGIVHRLDKETSGLMVIAKNNFTHEELAKQFKVHTITRKYHALVWGVPKNQTIEAVSYTHLTLPTNREV